MKWSKHFYPSSQLLILRQQHPNSNNNNQYQTLEISRQQQQVILAEVGEVALKPVYEGTKRTPVKDKGCTD
jgi:hypothetical protein